jgi:hypothetical protein
MGPGSLELLQEALDQAVELAVTLAHPLDLAERMDDRGVVLAA